MESLNWVDYLFIFSLVSIWMLLFVNIILSLAGYRYYLKTLNSELKGLENEKYPKVSILVPAHNEEKVIGRTVKSILLLNYPKDKMELIVINDNSSDNTKEILKQIQEEYRSYNFKIINTDNITGGRGKSNALNIGYKHSSGDFIAVYDADNTPDKNALKYLMETIIEDEHLGAVIGKFRTRNKDRNMLTRFINIETLSFQWMCQAGRWNLLNLCTIPGTNFVVRKNIIQKLNGWDPKAIAEDTEISFRIYELGYKIKFVPYSVTWEQEPENLKVWFKQRTRWAKGNIYVLLKYFKNMFKGTSKDIIFDIFYFFSVYFLFLSSVIISDILFIVGIFLNINLHVTGNFNVLWILAYVLFVLEVSLTLTLEKGESNKENLILVPIMYFTYCQMWMIVALRGIIQYIGDKLFKKEIKWYKTERF
ncbi:glycosyltransferase family 2 protein [Clostridium botulinum]|uniref:Glycosyl transferase, group 2 family protein n=1 Tax=Clostridium botulinum (strain Okra / Type B1) TaxID=498213 RepID=B1IJR5_CLOBK|nr:glycosyltransferase family 2 protein [Clostridium botulinum]EKX80378.1 glycosyl transferase family protein [Clostridium botulinum CFSAN001628]ACA45845.1 glycosyl transferase, group 2 family protein [Clostridium botulinum B1 str. Okra]MBD5562640.1 glycosyltransferase family 2 protein [Clostridium botulinum]MBD5565799.1 glycosyltransferase family 2 protein [Clostridium botulinum]MBD5569684.1 glycosyltransferase family 2 protein [Clostridium botulinum]